MGRYSQCGRESAMTIGSVQVLQSFHHTRGNDGRVFTWLGVRKQTARGEGHSGLAFDFIVPTETR
jgi:hypothetical protein